jgi:hypothetical protein
MPQVSDKRVFNGKMNKDVDPRFLENGDYIDALNVDTQNILGGRVASVTNLPGLEDVGSNTYLLKHALDTCIGIFSDRRTDVLYYFVAVDPAVSGTGVSDHRIVKYTPRTDTWSIVIEDEALNFYSTFPIYSFATTERYLFFTDNVNPPRVIDLEFDYTSPSSIDETYLNIAKIMPMKPIEFTLSSDSGRTGSAIYRKFFQFKYRYVFTNGQTSTFSPISDIAYSSDDYLDPNIVASLENQYNVIILTIPSENVNEMISHVEIAAREGNDGDFYIIKELEATSSFLSGTDLTYNFYNSGIEKTLELQESNQLFDDIPLLTKNLVFANNRLFMGNVTTGYDKEEVVYTVFPEIQDMPDPDYVYEGLANNRSALSDGTGNWLTQFLGLSLSYTITAGDYFEISGDNNGSPSGRAFGSAGFIIEAGWTVVDIINKALSYEFENGYVFTQTCDFLDDYDESTEDGGVRFYNTGFNIKIIKLNHQKTFKSGIKYKFGIQYYDEYGRSNGAQFSELNSELRVPSIPERGLTNNDYTAAGAVNAGIIISNSPPDWARYFKIVYSRSSAYTKSIQLTVVSATGGSGSDLVLNINSIDTWNAAKGGNLSYEFTDGDRVRVITYDQGSTKVQKDWAERLYEADIISYDISGNRTITIPDIGLTTAELAGSIIEIYNTYKDYEEEDLILNEHPIFGEVVFSTSSGNNGWVHKYNGVEQTLGTLTINGIEGDAWITQRNDFPIESSGTAKLIFESYSLSDFIDSELFSKGRPSAVINKEQSEAYATIVYTEALIPNTTINKLNRVYPDVNFEEFDRQFGQINLLFNEGDKILIGQDDQMSYSMLERAVNYDAQGQANYLGSVTNVLSKAIPLGGEIGIDDPLSFQEYNGVKFWVDTFRGQVIRMEGGQMKPISNVGMTSWFLQRCNALVDALDGYNRQVIGVYDPYKQSYIVSFSRSGGSTPYTVMWSEAKQGWTTRLDFVIRYGAYLNNNAYGQVSTTPSSWSANFNRFWTDTDYNSIGGVQMDDPFIEFPSNESGDVLKNYLGIVLDSTRPMSVVLKTEGISSETEQETEEYGWTQREQVWHSSFMRDKNTPNAASEEEARINGETMKGRHAVVKLSMDSDYNDSELVVLRMAELILSKG